MTVASSKPMPSKKLGLNAMNFRSRSSMAMAVGAFSTNAAMATERGTLVVWSGRLAATGAPVVPAILAPRH